VGLPWSEMLMVRKGFVVGMLAGLSIAGSTLWGLSSMPYLPGRSMEPPVPLNSLSFSAVPRSSVPSELAWFFIQFPYVSENSAIHAKNHHTYVVSDAARRREYVVTLGQHTRRIEVYNSDAKNSTQVQIFMPGYKKTVWFNGSRMMGQSTMPD